MCELPVCDRKNATDPEVCNQRGRCIAPDKCECNQYFVGKFCTDYSGLLIGLIILASLSIVAMFVVIIALTVGVACVYRVKVKRQNKAEMEMKTLLHASLIRSDELAEKIDRDWIIPFTELTFIEKLSEGSFGIVFKGRYQSADVYVFIHN